MPDGAFYLYVNCAGMIGRTLPDGSKIASDDDFVRACVEQSGVAFVPGSAFGLSPYFRIAYSVSDDQLRTAIQRLGEFCLTLS